MTTYETWEKTMMERIASINTPWNVGDWIVQPYSPYLVQVLRKAIERGRLRER